MKVGLSCAAVLVLSGALGAQAANPAPGANSVPAANSDAPPTRDESRMLALVNQERQQRQLAPLELDMGLTQAARAHTKLMVHQRALSHDFPGEPQLVQRFAGAGVHFDSAGENVAESNELDAAHEELMFSPPHRANILSTRYNAAGIGVINAPDGQVYVTEDFAHVTGKYSTAQIEDDVLAGLNSIRAKNALQPLVLRRVPMLEQEACKDQMNPKGIGAALAQAAWVGVFTSADPKNLPDDVTKLALHRDAYSVALGACFPPNAEQSFSLFQVIAVFFREPDAN